SGSPSVKLDTIGHNRYGVYSAAALDPNGSAMWAMAQLAVAQQSWSIAAADIAPPQTIKLIADNGMIGGSFQQPGGAGVTIFPRPEGSRVTLTGIETFSGAQPGDTFNLLSGTIAKGNRNITRSAFNKTPAIGRANGISSLYPLLP